MSKAEVLDNVRRALGAKPGDGRESAVSAWRGAEAAHPLPLRAKASGETAITDFTRHFEAQGVSVTRVGIARDVPKSAAAVLSNKHPGIALTAGSDAQLAAMPWVAAGLEIAPFAPGVVPIVGLSRAAAGIAETGTLVFASGPANPATLYYLPETHIAVIAASDIKGATEEALALARAASAPHAMPRTLALISGASRTADVGGKLVRGAHGPKTLAIIIVGEN